MPKEIIKKDGTKEPFSPEKIKKAVMAAAQEAGLPEDKKNEVVGKVMSGVMQAFSAKDEVTASEVNEKILAELDNAEPSVAAAWRKYEQEKK